MPRIKHLTHVIQQSLRDLFESRQT